MFLSQMRMFRSHPTAHPINEGLGIADSDDGLSRLFNRSGTPDSVEFSYSRKEARPALSSAAVHIPPSSSVLRSLTEVGFTPHPQLVSTSPCQRPDSPDSLTPQE